MKNRITIGVVTLSLLLSACNNAFLDRYPLDALTDETYWQTEEHLKLAANGCINYLRDKSRSIDMENLGDNTVRYAESDYRRISGGNFDSDISAANSEWATDYDAIRRCNHFLENYNRATKVKPEIRDRYAAEVRFIRAYTYTYLVNFFGDVQLITKTLNVDDPEVYGTRQPKEEIITWVLQELEEVAYLLPVSVATADFGRPTRGAALALKSRFALYHERWAVAEKAAKDVIDLKKYELYDNGNPQTTYAELFMYAGRASRNTKNKETILARVYSLSANICHNLSREIQVPDQESRFSPTRSLVDAYLCTDGKPVNLSSVYRENNYNAMFENRDPRFCQTLLKPGSAWGGRDDGDADDTSNDIFYLPKFKHDKKGCVTKTGWYFSKFVELSTVNVYTKDENDLPLIRYAEVLLNWAEARYKQGLLTQADVDNSINLIRKRVKMKSMNLAEIQSWGLNVEDEIRRERRVELAMEGERYFDILRWRQGYLLAQDVKGMKKMYAPNYAEVKDLPMDAQGNIIFLSGRKFIDPKNYLWPIPFIQLERNPNLGKNPGW